MLQVAGGTGSVRFVTGFDHESATKQSIVEVAERRVLNDEQHVEVVGRLQPFTDALASLSLKLVDGGVAAPHQAQAAPDRLLEQDGRL